MSLNLWVIFEDAVSNNFLIHVYENVFDDELEG